MLPSTHHRRTSRSNSGSNSISSSVTTVKKSASVSSKTNPRTIGLRQRPASPTEIPSSEDLLSSRTTVASQRGSADDRSAHNRNIHRWSLSTSSTTSAIDTEAVRKRMQDTSRRMSIGPGLSGNGAKIVTSPDRARNTSRQRPSGQSDASPYGPNLTTSQKYTQLGRSPNSSTSNLTPTSMFNTGSGDYFGENWHHRKQSSKLASP